MKKQFQKTLIYLMILSSALGRINAQNTNDTVNVQKPAQDSMITTELKKSTLNYKSLIIPTAFIAYGVAGLSIKNLKQLNLSTKVEINEHQPTQIQLDNYTQYAPAVMVYGFNAIGIKGKHNLRDRTIIYASSQLIAAAFTMPLKFLSSI